MSYRESLTRFFIFAFLFLALSACSSLNNSSEEVGAIETETKELKQYNVLFMGPQEFDDESLIKVVQTEVQNYLAQETGSIKEVRPLHEALNSEFMGIVIKQFNTKGRLDYSDLKHLSALVGDYDYLVLMRIEKNQVDYWREEIKEVVDSSPYRKQDKKQVQVASKTGRKMNIWVQTYDLRVGEELDGRAIIKEEISELVYPKHPSDEGLKMSLINIKNDFLRIFNRPNLDPDDPYNKFYPWPALPDDKTMAQGMIIHFWHEAHKTGL